MSEQRLIDAEKLKQNLNGSIAPYWIYPSVTKVVDEQPTVDAVHVVRCKDCIHWREYDKEMMCEAVSSDPYEAWASEANDYCSLGERKDGEQK